MDREKAKEILEGFILEDGNLGNGESPYIKWEKGNSIIILDGFFVVEDLEAIVWWMKNKGEDK